MGLQTEVSKMINYRNSDVIITQADGCQGDSLNRIGVYYSCLKALNLEHDDMGYPLELGLMVTLGSVCRSLPLGRFRRGYDKTRWFHNPDNVTRDQMAPVEAALALYDDVELARAHFKLRLRRLFLHFSTQNDGADAGPLIAFKFPDIPTLSEFGTLIRATKYKVLYFLLPLCDLNLLIDVKFGRSLSERALYDTDNQLLPQVLAMLDQPTFVSETVRRAYATTDAADRLKAYYSESNNRNGLVPLGEIAALAFKRCVGGLKN